jgi:hypothetical protein
MPTECPERRMTGREDDLVMAGVTDFIDGQWQEPITGRSVNARVRYFAHGEQV